MTEIAQNSEHILPARRDIRDLLKGLAVRVPANAVSPLMPCRRTVEARVTKDRTENGGASVETPWLVKVSARALMKSAVSGYWMARRGNVS